MYYNLKGGVWKLIKLDKTRESSVIRILHSSKKIEGLIKRSYKKSYEQVTRHPSVREEQMPIFVSFLYDLIIELGELPSNQIFKNMYMSKYYEDVLPDKSLYYAYLYRVNLAYESLVRDLHFYFLLRESQLFDNVLLSYAYDIEAKQDLVVTLGEKKLGLQLFKGTDGDIPLKRRQTERRRIVLGYPDFYLPLNGSKMAPVNIGTDNNYFYVYSDKDVRLVVDELKSQLSLTKNVDEERYVLPAEVTINQDSPNELTGIVHAANLKHPKNSFIYVGKKRIEENIECINDMISKGVRVDWISPNDEKGKGNLRVYKWGEASKYNFEIVDGNCTRQESEILERIGGESVFNFEQYAIEHASVDKHLIVEAGAGSGKTETIISRIIYLLHTGKVDSLKEIVMITFTNEAADQMKSKLSKRLFMLFNVTRNIRYINWSEEITSMSILTIPSFSKKLLQDFSSEIGMGKNFAVRSLTIERREIIEEVLDKYIAEQNLNYEQLGELRDFEIVKMVDSFWNQLEQKGIILENYSDIEWGILPERNIDKVYYNLFKSVLTKCEERFAKEKLKNDVFTVNDLTQKIGSIRPYLNVIQMSEPFNFLFVDEFQDTDDVQIDLVYTLTKITKAQLFVVGDIKQSIYRFRGANYTAFNLLTKNLGKNLVNSDYKLKKNYRTTSEILNPLENIFDVWRKHSLQLLPKPETSSGEGESRLKPTITSRKYIEPYIVDTSTNNISQKITSLYDNLIMDKGNQPENKPIELAVLVQTNFQVSNIRKILEKIRENDSNLVYEVSTGGSLFTSEAARDLLILLNAFCYEDDPESFYALHQTAFSTKVFNPEEYIDLEGNKEKLLQKLSFAEVKGYKEAKKDLRRKPILHAIYHFLASNSFEEILTAGNEQKHDIQKYRLNLFRILEIASDTIDSPTLSILGIRDWLNRQVATNRNEDEMEVDTTDYKKLIRVMTIHKAKGLEFDTVFIPYTNQPLIKKTSQNMIVVRENEKLRAGWKTIDKSKNIISSSNYDDIKKLEDEESLREAARLLYVALTRAKHQLVVNCIEPKYPKNKLYNWSELIRLGKEGGR